MAEAVLCDFDGTLVELDTMELIYNRFASCGMYYAEKWSRGEISTIEEVTSTFATIDAGREEFEALFDEIQLIPGVEEFLHGCERELCELAVVSDGMRWYIDRILNRHGLEGIRVYANSLYIEPDGFKFSWPWYDPDVPLRSSSKAEIVRRWQRRGYQTTFIGNGKSDTHVVGVADRLFARDWLADYCEDLGADYVRFTDFHDLMEKW